MATESSVEHNDDALGFGNLPLESVDIRKKPMVKS
jgi:hypothetical protein